MPARKTRRSFGDHFAPRSQTLAPLPDNGLTDTFGVDPHRSPDFMYPLEIADQPLQDGTELAFLAWVRNMLRCQTHPDADVMASMTVGPPSGPTTD